MNKTYLYLYDINVEDTCITCSSVYYNLYDYKKNFPYLDKRIIQIDDKDSLSLYRNDYHSEIPTYILYNKNWYRVENYDYEEIKKINFNKLYTDKKKKIRELKIKRLFE